MLFKILFSHFFFGADARGHTAYWRAIHFRVLTLTGHITSPTECLSLRCWVSIWRVIWCLLLNVWWHKWQRNGFSPVWVLIWSAIWLDLPLINLQQNGQWFLALLVMVESPANIKKDFTEVNRCFLPSRDEMPLVFYSSSHFWSNHCTLFSTWEFWFSVPVTQWSTGIFDDHDFIKQSYMILCYSYSWAFMRLVSYIGGLVGTFSALGGATSARDWVPCASAECFLAQWRERWCLRENFSPQSKHWYGFSPVCVLMWYSMWRLLPLISLLHSRQVLL